MGLSHYQKKRDFAKTAEPRGEKKALSRTSVARPATHARDVEAKQDKTKRGIDGGKGRARGSAPKGPIFVVQRHAARALHYDFRLELGGVLKSWAVPKGPSPRPGEKRLAVEVEDHPIAYAEFAGTIPKHQYGAGEVRIWDRGIWVPPARARQKLRAGSIEFGLRGRRLKGQWQLVRMGKNARGARQPQWLLIKKREGARPSGKSPGAEGRGLGARRRAREAAPTREKRAPPRPQLPTLVAKPPVGPDWAHEIKFDGYRTLAASISGNATLWTRSGLDWTARYGSLAKELGRLKARQFVIDGEVVAIDERGRSDFSLLQENLSKGMVEGLVYYAFDLLELDGEDWRGRPLRQRKARLRALLRASRASRVLFSGDWRGSASKMLAQACGAGLEGIVSKRLGDPYVGARTTSWLKAKCGLREEFVVGGFTAPRGQRQEIGALLVGSYDKQNKFIYKGKVGSGLGDRDLKALRARLRPLEARSSPFAAGPALERGARWARPELVIEAGFRSWTRDGLLRQAFFKGAREDKPARAVAAQARPSLSHPEKIMYPQEGISKAQVAAYYQGVSEYMLPFVARRPLSIVRCPDGIGGQAFYQKHLGRERPGGIYEKEIAIGGRRRRVAWIEGIDGLLALAQLAALEIHLWQATIDRPNSPDQIVLDLDPHESVSWQDVKKAAFALRDELTELKLASFVKLTGGKGLHVQVPISGISGWAQEKNLAKALAARFCERHPKKFTLSPMKGRRDGRIFIDYLRNGLGATAIAPFSLRARPGAPVALPASWEELSRVSSPAQWTMSRFLRRLERGYELPWPRPPGGSGALGY